MVISILYIGIYCDNTAVEISDNDFEDNDKGVFCGENSSVNLTDSYFTDNNKSVFIYKSGHLNISDCSFYSNTNGLYAWEANGSVNNCSFVGNVNDYITKASSNLTVWDSYYSYVDGNVSWSYEETELNYSGDDPFEMDAIRIGDVDGDGYNDIVALNRSYVSPSVDNLNLTIYLYNTTTNDFDLPVNVPLYQGDENTRSLDLENLDIDGEYEIIVAYDNITVLDWDGSTWVYTAYSPFADTYKHSGIDCKDVDDDGNMDIVTISEDAAKAYVYLWDGVGSEFDLGHSLSLYTTPVSVFINDTNDDGLNDIVVKYDSGQYISMFNQTVAGFDPRYDMPFGSNVYCDELIIDDINNDGKNDVVAEVVYSGSATGYRLAYRLWNSTSSEFNPVQHFAGDVIPLDDMEYFDCDADGVDEIVSAAYGTEIEVYSITDLKWEKENFFGDLQPLFYSLDHGILDDDVAIDMVCGGISGSILLWNGSTSNTTRNVRVEVRNDTDAGEAFALVTINDTYGTEVFNETTNETGVTPIRRITLAEESLISEVRYGPFRMDISKFVGGTWYNITRFLNITPFTGLYDVLIYLGNDTDNDGLTDGRETYVLESNASNSDTDGDSILDGTEDGVNDTTKPSTTGAGFVADSDINTTTSTIENDTDADGLLDGIEDADADGYQDSGETDPNDLDSDDDTLPDGWMDLNFNGKKNLGEYEDYDLDGVQDGGAWGSGGETDPLDNDTDGGGMDDDEEIWENQDPLDPSDDGGSRRRETRGDEGGGDESQQGEEAVIGEIGTVEFPYDHVWATVNLQRKYMNPIVIASPVGWQVGDENRNPVITYIREVESSSFRIRIDTWSQQPEPDWYDVVNYLVLEEGEYTLTDGTRIKAGKGITTPTDQKITVNFGDFFESTPIVLTHSQTWWNDQFDFEDGDKSLLDSESIRPFVTRMNLVSTGYELEIVSENDNYEVPEEIGYIAIENEYGEVNDILYDSGTYYHNNNGFHQVSDSFNQVFSTPPIIFAEVQTNNNEGPVALRVAEDIAEGTSYLKMEEPINTIDESESIGWLAFEDIGLIKGLITIGEVGTINFDDPNVNFIQHIRFNNVYKDPVVIAKPFSYGTPSGTKYAPVRTVVTNVGQTSCDIEVEKYFTDEDDDRTISGTQVHYIVMEKGNYWLAESGLKVQVGDFEFANQGIDARGKKGIGWHTTFAWNWFDEAPLVFTQYGDYPQRCDYVISQTQPGRWLYGGCMFETPWDTSLNYNVGYIAIEAGNGDVDGIGYEFGKVNNIQSHKPSTVTFDNVGAEEPPLFIASIQKYFGIGTDIKTFLPELRFCYPSGEQGVKLRADSYLDDSNKVIGSSADEVSYMAFDQGTNIYAWKTCENTYTQEESVEWEVKGDVYDVDNHAPIVAKVELNDNDGYVVRRTYSDSGEESGEYAFTGLEPGTYTLVATHSDYKTARFTLQLGEATRTVTSTRSHNQDMGMERDNDGNTHSDGEPGWGDGKTKYITELEVIGIDCFRTNDPENDPNGGDEVYLIANNIRYPHKLSEGMGYEPEYDPGWYHYYVREGEDAHGLDYCESTIDTRISTTESYKYYCEVWAYEDDEPWYDGSMGTGREESEDLSMGSWGFTYRGAVKDIDDENDDWGNLIGLYFSGEGLISSITTDEEEFPDIGSDYLIKLRARTYPIDEYIKYEIIPFKQWEEMLTMEQYEDYDNDGLSNQDEYDLCMNPTSFGIHWDYGGLANPIEKDIFLEIDTMEDITIPMEGIVKVATRFAEEGIKLHIDDGCFGIDDESFVGGEDDLPYHEKMFTADGDINCYMHFKITNPERVGVFSYCILADELMIIPDTMGIEGYAHGGYEYGFALEGDNEYFFADFGKCISMYNPSSKDGDDDELTYLGEIFYGTDPTKTDTDGEGIPDHRDREPLKYNRRLAFIFTVDNYPGDEIDGSEGSYLYQTLTDSGFNYICFITDENEDLILPEETELYMKTYDRLKDEDYFHNAVDIFEKKVDSKPSNYGDDLVIMYISGHGGSYFKKWGLALATKSYTFMLSTDIIWEGTFSKAVDDIGTVDLLWFSSCNSNKAYDDYSDSDDLFVIGCGDGGGQETPIDILFGLDRSTGLLNGWNLKDSFLKLDDWDSDWSHENHLEYDLCFF